MSIIHDALKKAGQPIIAQDEKRTSSPVRPEILLHKKRPTFNWSPVFVVAALAFVTGPFLVPLFRSPSPAAPVSMGEEVSNKLPQFAIEETPIRPSSSSWMGMTPKAEAMPKFSLSGVVYSDYESYCLINGKVLRVGETIGDATVESISPDSVTLNRLGEKIVVPVTA